MKILHMLACNNDILLLREVHGSVLDAHHVLSDFIPIFNEHPVSGRGCLLTLVRAAWLGRSECRSSVVIPGRVSRHLFSVRCGHMVVFNLHLESEHHDIDGRLSMLDVLSTSVDESPENAVQIFAWATLITSWLRSQHRRHIHMHDLQLASPLSSRPGHMLWLLFRPLWALLVALLARLIVCLSLCLSSSFA